MKEHFTNKHRCIASKHRKRRPTPSVVRELQNKTAWETSTHILEGLTLLNVWTPPADGEDWNHWNPCNCCWEWETVGSFDKYHSLAGFSNWTYWSTGFKWSTQQNSFCTRVAHSSPTHRSERRLLPPPRPPLAHRHLPHPLCLWLSPHSCRCLCVLYIYACVCVSFCFTPSLAVSYKHKTGFTHNLLS